MHYLIIGYLICIISQSCCCTQYDRLLPWYCCLSVCLWHCACG